MPSVSIYRPPAARKLEQNANLSNLQGRDVVGGSALEESKLKCSEEVNSANRRGENDGMSVFRNAITSIRAQNKVPRCKNVESTNKKSDVELNINKSEEVSKSNVQSRQRRPDIQVYVPKGRRIANVSNNNSSNIGKSNNTSTNHNNNSVNDNSSSNSSNSGISNNNNTCSPVSVEKTYKNSDPCVSLFEEVSLKAECIDISDRVNEKTSSNAELVKTEEEIKPANGCCKVSENVSVGIEKLEKKQNGEALQTKVTENDIEKVESPSLSNLNLNNSSQIAKDSDPLGLNNKNERVSSSVKNVSENVGENKNSVKKANSVHLNPDECDWESMFDDTGECLDPSLLEQLTSAVGEVTIEKPKSSYNDFKTKSLDMVADEFPHVIEIYNFPPEFQLQDLMTVFSQFKNSGFEIKWVDDTHALGIFSSSAIVSEVLAFYHPFVKTRSLKEGTPLSKMKARRSAEFLQPYKPRPDTCPALARRLVTGALGVKLPTSREEREAEKKILTKAREKKKLEAKQKEDAWEGTFS